MLNKVSVEKKSLRDYQKNIGEERIQSILNKAKLLKDVRVVHINATAYGGGVAEILQSLVPLMNSVGLQAEWQVIEGSDDFFNVTKACHNGLQGMDIPFSREMKEIWKEYNQKNAALFEGEYDFIIVHDPQPAGLLKYHGRGSGKHWLWRCHIDTSFPNPEYWDFFLPFINPYDVGVFTMEQFVGPGIKFKKLAIIPPKIDPLSSKNASIPKSKASEAVEKFGLDKSRPFITQVSRFDPWKDPLGVIDAYRQVKQQIPKVQLALIGSMAADDPEGWYYLDKTIRHAGGDYDIHILHNFHGVGAFEVGCFQTVSDVVVQKSLREGFGLVVTEAMWKGKPVIGGNVGGIVLQVIHGKTGFLVNSVEECAEKILFLLKNPEKTEEMGVGAREYVRENFLITRHLEDYLDLFLELNTG